MYVKDLVLQLILGLILVLGVVVGGFSILGYLLQDTGPGSYSVEIDSFLEEGVN